MEKLSRIFCGYQEKHDHVYLSTDNQQAVADADLVISVTSTINSIFDAEDFKAGTIVCDVGFPKNIAATCNTRKDIIVFSGGLAEIPGEIQDLDVMGLPANHICYGCMCEGILLSLENRFDLCTLGMADIPLDNVDLLIEKGYEHGFDVAPFFNDFTHYTENDFERIRVIREN
jgi:predicted amino acid dehydrogenase